MTSQFDPAKRLVAQPPVDGKRKRGRLINGVRETEADRETWRRQEADRTLVQNALHDYMPV